MNDDKSNDITLPPNDVVQQWRDEWFNKGPGKTHYRIKTQHVYIAAQAALWGADQELKACCEALDNLNDGYWSKKLLAARRPKPPSLREQALALLDKAENPSWDINDFSIVRQALEALPND
jgi:hypothetical protein